MSMLYDYQYDIAAIAISIALLIIYWSRKNFTNKSNQLYFALLVCSLLSSGLDLISCFTISYPERYPLWLIYFSALGYIFFFNMMGVLFLLYLDSKTKIRRIKKPIAYLARFVTVFDFIVIASSPFTHMVAYLDENLQYRHGPFMLVLYVISILLLIIPVFSFYFSRKRFNTYQVEVSWALLILMLLCVVVQAVSSRVLIGGLACSIALIFSYCAYENPAYYSFRDTQCFNNKAFMEKMKSRSFLKKESYLIIGSINDFLYLTKSLGINHSEMLTSRVAEYFFNQFGRKAYCVGDDIFVVLFDDADDTEGCMEKIRHDFERPIKISDSQVSIKMNTHLLKVAPEYKVIDVIEMIQYLARLEEREAAMNIKDVIGASRRRQHLRHIIKNAIDNDSFDVYYQPIRNVTMDEFNSVEALIRLIDDELGFISPEEFIPIAEECNYICDIGEIVFKRVCKFINDTNCMNGKLHYVEMNLSPLQCFQENLVEHFQKIMNEYNIDPLRINLEITETADFREDDTMVNNIEQLSQMGVGFSLDDYGSGFASLDYLFRLPVSIVKIDKSILWRAMEDEHAMVILSSTMKMLKELKKQVVVEGVESEEMVDILEDMCCDYMQGFYYSKPLPEEEYKKFMGL